MKKNMGLPKRKWSIAKKLKETFKRKNTKSISPRKERPIITNSRKAGIKTLSNHSERRHREQTKKICSRSVTNWNRVNTGKPCSSSKRE